MEQIIITKPDGSTYPLASKRTATEIKSAKQSWALLADDVVSISIESPFPQTYGIGDHFTVFGRTYKLNRLPKVKKTGMHAFSYDLEFEGIQYDLIRATYDLTIDTTNNQLQDVQADTLTGDLRRFARVLTSNANRVYPATWYVGAVPKTIDDKTLAFGETDNCLSVLQKLCTEFGVEFEIIQSNGKFTINFVSKVGQTFPFTFEFGKGKGLYSLDRQNVDSSNIITRLKVYGSTSNITNKYRASRLCLPGKTKAQSYIEKPEAVAKYGIYESTKYFDDIKPTFNGSITGLVSGSVLNFIDTKMFDLNALEADGKTTKYKMVGCAPKVHFNTGNLAGYEFEAAYDHSTNTFTLVKQKDNMDYEFPSSKSQAFQFSVGNKYKLIDVALPDSPYQNDAENKLNEQGNIYYDQNSQPKVQYGLSVTKAYLKTLVGNGTTVNIFAPGDYIPVKDSDIDVDKSVRIKSLTRNLLDEYEYTLTISDTVTTTITNRVISDLIDVDKVITINNLKDPARARANWRSSREVLNMVFDPDGDYYTDKIKPNSIDTLALSVGAKSMQFGLTNTIFQPNFKGNKNLIYVQGGILTHYTINADSERSWFLADCETTFGADSQAHYIYAKCQRVGTDGSIIFPTEQIKVEQDANFYHFWIGVVNSVDRVLKARTIALSYGFTMINGRFISTGRIQSSGGGTTYFDLDAGEIGGNIKFVASDGSTKKVSDLDNVAQETKGYIKNTLPGVLRDIQAQLDGQIEQFFETYDPTTTNAPANTWTTNVLKEYHLEDLFYNTTSGAVFRWIKNGNDYSWSKLADAEVAQALALANDAIALAATKRRIFTETPYTPYDIGDLWAQGKGGDIMKCKTTRATGSYSSSDWEKASNYTNDAALTEFINGSYITTVTDLTNQLDGKIESWFQDNDPSTDWTTAALKAKHVGDMWYSSTGNKLKRYSSSYAWVDITDQKAIDAYDAASKAQDTADKKRQVFVAQPYTPYDIGDLWLKDWIDNGVNKQELYRCITARSAGSYITNDWVIAVYYDNTKATINGSIVTSGTVQLAGDDASIKAGITGEGTAESSVRFWAGASKENRATAPYRVLQDGTAVMSKAEVTGIINANSGAIGGFEIGDGRIGTKLTGDAEWTNTGASFYKDMLRIADVGKEVSIGTSIGPSIFPNLSQLGFFKNTKSDNEVCRGIKFLISGEGTADTNIALYGCGNYVTNGIVCGYELDNNYINLSTASTLVRDYKFHQFYLVKSTVTHPFFALPNRVQVAKELGIKGDEPFAVKVTYISDKDNTTVWTLYGRSEDLFSNTRPLWDNHYPRIVDNGDFNYNKMDFPKGAKAEFFLTYNPKAAREDMTYYAYLLGFRN